MPLSWYATEIELSTFHCDMLSSLYEIAQGIGIGISHSISTNFLFLVVSKL